MPHEEHRTEARAEGRLWLRDAALRSGYLRRIAREEVVHRLLARELRDGRQHAERIGREEHDVPGMPTPAIRDVMLDVMQWIRRSRVLGDRLIGESYLTRQRIEDHVL